MPRRRCLHTTRCSSARPGQVGLQHHRRGREAVRRAWVRTPQLSMTRGSWIRRGRVMARCATAAREYITEHFNTPECSRLAVRRWPTWLAVPVGDRRGHLARIPGGRWSPRRRSLPTTTCWRSGSTCWPEVACIEGGLKAYAMASYRDELYWRNADTAEDRKALVELLPAYLNCLLDKASWTSEKRKRAANAALVFADTSAEIHHPLFRGLGPW